MNLPAEKLKLIEWIAKINDSSIIEKLQKIHLTFGEPKTTDWWDEISIKEKESIKKGLKDLEEGRVHSHETAKRIYEKHL